MASFDESVKSSSEESFQQECSPCGLDGAVREAKYFCTDCQEYLCQPCEAQHKRFKGTRDHTVSLCGDAKLGSQDEDCSAVLCSCKRSEVQIFCKYHNEAICSDCKTINHRLCNTKPVDDVISAQDTDFDKKTLEFSEEVKGNIENLVQERQESLEKLNADTERVKEEILLFRNELKNRIDNLTEKSLDDLKAHSGRHNEVIQHHLTTCETALKTLSVDSSEYQKLKETQNKRQKFVMCLKLTKTLRDLNALALDIRAEIYEPTLAFEENSDMSNVSNMESLGTVKHNARSIPREFNANLTIKSSRRVNVKLSPDNKVPWITGSVFLPNGDIILCDRLNKCVKHFNSEFRFVESVNLTGEPRGCCLMNGNELIVSLSDKKQIQMFQTLPAIQLQNTINLDKQCEDIDVLGEDIYVICHDKPDKEIRIMDREGNLKRKIDIKEHNKQDDIFCPFYIAVSTSGDIFVSESNYGGSDTGQIRRLRSNGSYRYTVSNKDTVSTGGLLLDENDSLLACFWRLNSVLLISEDGSKCENYFGPDTDKLDMPYSISFRKIDATLVVAYRKSNDMLVYKME